MGGRGWIAGAMALLAVAGTLAADGRSLASILEEMDSVEYPGFVSDMPEEEFHRLVEAAATRECSLAKELWRAAPEHPRVPSAMLSRWTLMRNVFQRNRDVFEETGAVLEGDPGALKIGALYARAFSALELLDLPLRERLEHVDRAVKSGVPEGDLEWKANLLCEVAQHHVADPEHQRRIIQQVLTECRQAETAHEAVVLHRVMKLIGTTLELAFEDALGGGRVDLAELRGRPAILVVFSHHDLKHGTGRRRAFQQLGGFEEVSVVGVLVERSDDGVEEARNALFDLGLRFPIWDEGTRGVDRESWAEARGMTVTPWFLLLDEKGVVTRVAARPRPLLEVASER